jgi:hypothetical protein
MLSPSAGTFACEQSGHGFIIDEVWWINLALLLFLEVTVAVPINHKSEESMIRLRRGKWSQPGVPHHGWICVGMEDLGEPTGECEMCESQAIRYVHQMKHPEYPDELGVGCVCAEHMETDKGASRSREKDLKNVAEKRKRWLTRKWRLSEKGIHS